MRKYKKGKQVTKLSQLDKQEFIYVGEKVYHIGWWGSWQFRMVVEYIERGKIYLAIKKEEKKDNGK